MCIFSKNIRNCRGSQRKMAAGYDDYEKLATQQRLKAAVHYTVGELCRSYEEENDVSYSKQFIAVLSEATYKYAQTISTDLEAFAKHAKRMTINVEDVKLMVRKSQDLHAMVCDRAEQIANESEEKKTKSKKGRPKKKAVAASNVADDDDSN